LWAIPIFTQNSLRMHCKNLSTRLKNERKPKNNNSTVFDFT
jgi:hypothetical protein